MEKKQPVAAFAWEPAGDRFALVLGDVPKLEVTFYTMKVSNLQCLSPMTVLNPRFGARFGLGNQRLVIRVCELRVSP